MKPNSLTAFDIQRCGDAPPDPAVLLICADSSVTWRYIGEFSVAGGLRFTQLASNLTHARKLLAQGVPRVILMDESCLEPGTSGETLEHEVSSLAEFAPVVVVAAPQNQEPLALLITSGAVDFVSRLANFSSVAAGLIARRLREGVRNPAAGFQESSRGAGFGELLRHEVNNPLTGILGNAEMLLKHREGLPPNIVARLETIADLSVRLRETVRRLSECWEANHESVHAL
jgi:signal transduction histidine kinase